MKSSSAYQTSGISKELWKPFVKSLVKRTVRTQILQHCVQYCAQHGCMVTTSCATIHVIPSWTLKFLSDYSTKCCRWCIHKEICWAQCCRSRTKFYCCNNAHYCSQKRQVDTQYNLATARNCVMYLGLNECGNHSDSVCMFFLNHSKVCCSNTCDFRLNQSCNSLLSKNIKWNWNSWWKLSQIPVHPLRMASLLEIL